MGAPEASLRLHSGSEGEDKEKGRRVMRVKGGQSPKCWVKTVERDLCSAQAGGSQGD